MGVGLALEELGFQMKTNESPESDFDISTYVGSSAGSLICLYYASGIKPIDLVNAYIRPKRATIKPITYKNILSLKRHYNLKQKNDYYQPFNEFPVFLKTLLIPFLKISGLFTTKGIYNYLENTLKLDPDFNNYKADLFIVATQLDHSRKVIFSKYKFPSPYHDPTAVYYTDTSVLSAVSASMSVPPFYSPYPIDNPITKKKEYYIDGEIRETLSNHVAVDNKAKVVISSWTHTPYHFHDEIGSLTNYGLPAICTQAIYLMIQKKIVSSRARNARAHDIINTVNDYMKTHKFDNKHRLKLLNILERKLDFNSDVEFIDICPKHENYELFFKSPFSLNPNTMATIVKLGHKRTHEVFKELNS